jgi:hypothetical protein
LLHGQPFGLARNTTALLFSRSNRYSPATINLIRVDSRIACRPKPTHYPYACTRAFGSCDPHTRALLLPSFLSLLASGCREAISVFTYPPFLLPSGLPPMRFLGRGILLPPQGSGTTTKPCLRAPMGERHADALRLSLLGRSRASPVMRSSCPDPRILCGSWRSRR